MIWLIRRVLEGRMEPHVLVEYVESEVGPLSDDELAELLEEIEVRRNQYKEGEGADVILAAYISWFIDEKKRVRRGKESPEPSP